jgi:flagellar basal-body rod protein FlgC
MGRETDSGHLPIPARDFPRDERFFGNGVQVAEIREDDRPPRMVYDPAHPDADSNGYVAMPNINVVKEMADMIAATRTYEANVTAFNATKAMLQQALQL